MPRKQETRMSILIAVSLICYNANPPKNSIGFYLFDSVYII